MPSQYPLVYGLHDMEEYRDRTVQSVGITVMQDAVQEWLNRYTQTTDEFLSTVLARDPRWNTSPISRTRLPFSVDYQLVDEDGKADPVTSYLTYDIGLPLFRRELAAGWTWERRQVLTVDDINEWLWQIMFADSRFFRTAAKYALFYDQAWEFYSHEEDQNMPSTIPILPLANGDSQEYPLKTGGTTTADHYTAQAAQVGSGNDPFPTIVDTLSRYSTVQRSRPRLVSFVNGTALVAGITGLDDFFPYERTRYIQRGTGETTVQDSIEQELFFGDRVLGEHLAGVVVVEWDDLPDNYIVTMDMDQLPLGLRQRPEPGLQGLVGMSDIMSHYGNESHDRVRRIAGVGVVNRTAAHIHFTAAGDTTYDVPTGYTPSA